MATSDSTSSRPRRVFLSYAQGDNVIARQIVEALKKAGLKVWFDEWALRAGDSIAQRIDQAVETSDLFIVLLSPRSVKSKWVQKELNAALSRELTLRAVTVILIEDCEIPSLLANRLYLDLRSDLEGGIKRLIQRLGVASDIVFSRLDGRIFENLVADLLTALGFLIERQPIGPNSGFDFRAKYITHDPFGAQKEESWLVEVKFYRSQRVSVSALQQMLGYMTVSGSQRGLVVTNGQLTSVARNFLDEVSSRFGQELRLIDGTELTHLLLQHPQLVERYFVLGIDK